MTAPENATCRLCGEQIDGSGEGALTHVRLMHPDQYEPPARWPDGGLVVVDQTLEPDDFGGAA